MGAGGVPNHGTYQIEAKKLSPTFKPNSKVDRYENGEKKQSRWYGPDGRASRNRDYAHQDAHNNHKFPHEHNWDWNRSNPRLPDNLEPDYANFKD